MDMDFGELKLHPVVSSENIIDACFENIILSHFSVTFLPVHIYNIKNVSSTVHYTCNERSSADSCLSQRVMAKTGIKGISNRLIN